MILEGSVESVAVNYDENIAYVASRELGFFMLDI